MKPAAQPTLSSTPRDDRNCGHIFPGWKSMGLWFSMLLIAVLAGIGQDRFYAYLHGRLTEEVSISQAWVSRVGNTFAYLFKTVLVLAVGKAFCQAFWLSIRRDALRLGTISAIFNLLGNPLNVLDQELRKKRFGLLTLAIITWMIPLCAVFSPGALTGCQDTAIHS